MSEWRDVPYWPGYMVSDEGEVVRKKDGVILKQYLQKSGYLYVWLDRGFGRCSLPVHRIVASAFLEPVEGKNLVDHINTIRNDNRLCNLRWASPLDNANNETTKLNRKKLFDHKLKTMNKTDEYLKEKIDSFTKAHKGEDPEEILADMRGKNLITQPLMLQSDCTDCKLYEGFGQCYEHGNDLIENCKDYRKE